MGARSAVVVAADLRGRPDDDGAVSGLCCSAAARAVPPTPPLSSAILSLATLSAADLSSPRSMERYRSYPGGRFRNTSREMAA